MSRELPLPQQQFNMEDSLYQDASTNMHAANEDVAKFMGTFGNMNYNVVEADEGGLEQSQQSIYSHTGNDLTSMNLTPSNMMIKQASRQQPQEEHGNEDFQDADSFMLSRDVNQQKYMTPPDKSGNEFSKTKTLMMTAMQVEATEQGTNTEHWADLFMPEVTDGKHNVSFCGDDDLLRNVQTKLTLEQFNKMYEGDSGQNNAAATNGPIQDDSLIVKH